MTLLTPCVIGLIFAACVHDAIRHPEVVSVSRDDRFGEVLEERGLRVKFYFGETYCKRAGERVVAEDGRDVTCKENDVLTEAQRGVVSDMLERTAGWAHAALNVKKPSRRLRVGTRVCGQIPVPTCMLQNGVEDADFVGFVSALPMRDGRSSTIAWSVPCLEEQGGRTIAGQINIVPSMVRTTTTPDQYHNSIMVIIHELFHALGLSSRFWSDVNNNHRPRHGWFATSPHPIITSINNTFFLTTPAVKREVQAHFNCPTIPGVPIEKHGGTGSQGSHWEQMFLGPEAMTYSISSRAPVMMSRITLAYFEDTGFYTANYEVADHAPVLTYGRGSCLNHMHCEGKDMCNSLHQLRCSPDRTGMAICTARENCKYWSHHYLCSSAPADPCHKRLTAHECFGVSSFGAGQQRCAWDNDKNKCYDELGNTYSQTARCFDSSAHTSTAVPGVPEGRCYDVSCDYANATYTLTVGEEVVVCVGEAVQVTGFVGSVRCLDFDAVCDKRLWKGEEEQLVYKMDPDVAQQEKEDECVVPPVVTLVGCECQMAWEVSGSSGRRCTDSCCSFEGEAKWCFVINPDCQGAASGPCEHLVWYGFVAYNVRQNWKALMILFAACLLTIGYYARQHYLRKALAESSGEQPQPIDCAPVPMPPVDSTSPNNQESV